MTGMAELSEKKMDRNLISNVTEQGLLIPKEWLIGVEKAEIFKKGNIITVRPIEKDDPIFQLGTKPLSCGIKDGSEEHDKYIYG
jgi:hypothetical protein